MSASTTANPFGSYQHFFDKENSRRLYNGGILALILGTLWSLNKENWNVNGQILWGILIMTLASYPALIWAKRAERWLPLFEIAMLMVIPQYAIPLLSNAKELQFYPETTISRAASLITLYIIISISGFSMIQRPFRLKKLFLIPIIPKRAYSISHIGIFLSNIYLIIANFSTIVPSDLQRILGTLFLGLSTISVFTTAQLWGLNLLAPQKKLFFYVNISINVLLSFTGLYLIVGFGTVSLAIISYSVSKKKIPWITTVFFILFISILHLGKADMRMKYWSFSEGRNFGSSKLEIDKVPSFFMEWINYGLTIERASKHQKTDRTSSLERASLFPLVCLAVDRVPREKEYLMGESYADILSLLVPRILWNNKPTALEGNDKLMVHLGLVNPDNITVNIALGFPTEAYINFGFIGTAFLGLFFGFFYKKIALLSQNAPQFSVVGIFSILLIATASQADQTLVIWISTVFQLSAGCIGIPLTLKVTKLLPSSKK